MNWKIKLMNLEQSKNWRSAIDLLEEAIKIDNDNKDAYLSMNYLLMNLLVEEKYNDNEHDFYAGLLKKYFLESYSKYIIDPEYLFYTGVTAHMSEWYFDIEIEEAKKMIKDAFVLEPENNLYKWGFYTYLKMDNENNKKQSLNYSMEILKENSIDKIRLKSKGAIGQYILNLMEHLENVSRSSFEH